MKKEEASLFGLVYVSPKESTVQKYHVSSHLISDFRRDCLRPSVRPSVCFTTPYDKKLLSRITFGPSTSVITSCLLKLSTLYIPALCVSLLQLVSISLISRFGLISLAFGFSALPPSVTLFFQNMHTLGSLWVFCCLNRSRLRLDLIASPICFEQPNVHDMSTTGFINGLESAFASESKSLASFPCLCYRRI
jgi:hypothetical protein